MGELFCLRLGNFRQESILQYIEIRKKTSLHHHEIAKITHIPSIDEVTIF